MSRRTVLALATGSLLLGGFAAPALAAPAVDNEQVCVITRYEPDKGIREGFCVWFPKVVPDLP
jgi:hypothetical protein